jgi:hypothetical protein
VIRRLAARRATVLIVAVTVSGLAPRLQARSHQKEPAKGDSKEPAKSEAKEPAKSDAPKSVSQTLTGAAKADFEAAKLLANDGDFTGALIKFGSAYEASKDPRILWNVAFCQKNLRRYSKVVTTLKRYIEQGASLLSAGDKKDAQELIAMIEPFTTRATVRVSEAGAQISFDDELAGTSPLAAPVVLDIGERRLHVVKGGFAPYDKTFVVAGGPELTLDVRLDKEVHEGKLVVEAPAGATVYVDDLRVGVGRTEQRVATGGHQLRVTAPGMRPYQTEVIVQDRETRSLTVLLEAVAPSEKPMLRVAVGCADAEPKGPEDGLVVNVDGPDVLPPGPVKRRWSDAAGRNVVEYAQYPIAPGRHAIRVSLTDCRSLDETITVDPVRGADLTGALASSRFILFRGPLGAPGWTRVALGLWKTAGSASVNTPERYAPRGLDITGAALEVGLVGRWFGLFLNAAHGSGTFTRQTFNSNYALPAAAHTTWERLLLRLGPRLPFNRAALGLGGLVGVEEIDVAQVRTGKPSALIGAFVELDVQPLCDWGLFALGSFEKPADHNDPSAGVQVGIFFAPNAECRRVQATEVGLHAK